MKRSLQPEWLDELPASDPEAIRSREDLRRVNTCMGNARIITRALCRTGPPAGRIVDLGAGDGTFLLSVAMELAGTPQNAKAVLLDRRRIVTGETLEQFHRLGWRVEVLEADLFEWLDAGGPQSGDVVTANLFLHHFPTEELSRLFASLEATVDTLVACEPRRSRFCLAFAGLLGLIGCNRVTRHDATISVAAGFRNRELSELWPENGSWNLHETRAGWFSHLFHATRPRGISPKRP